MKKAKATNTATAPGLSLPAKIGAAAAALVLAGVGAVYALKGPSGQAPDHHAAHQVGNAAPAVAAAGVHKAPAPGPAPDGMVWVPGGAFAMGCDDCEMPDAKPVHPVAVNGFWMDKTPITNAQFAAFVKATGYKTVAERKPDAKDFPGVPEAKLVAGSAVFSPPPGKVSLENSYAWWRYVPGANWKSPEGPGSDIAKRANHPVVHIAWDDAAAYAKWAGKRLPTEAEFEFAARGGLEGAHFAWGNELKPRGQWAANIWQGRFPSENKVEDRYRATSPVDAFPPNGFGLYDMGGNVWQWCADWYRPDYFAELATQGTASNPQGPADSHDPQEPGIAKRVQKSGSFLCSDQYCSRYFVGSRGKGATDSGSSNVGFRCVK